MNRITTPADDAIHSFDDLALHLDEIQPFCSRMKRPFVTVSYAQSIDGSIAARDRTPLRISNQASMTLTHRLRSVFDSILVGIETVLADNPQLSVRLVEGSNPQPVVLDTHLRTPPNARLLQRMDVRSWLVSAGTNPAERVTAITRTGASVLTCRPDARGRVDLRDLGGLLHERGIRSLMVEGGARVITSFIRARMVDLFVITISPVLIGGLQVVDPTPTGLSPNLRLKNPYYDQMEGDLVLWARPDWNHP